MSKSKSQTGKYSPCKQCGFQFRIGNTCVRCELDKYQSCDKCGSNSRIGKRCIKCEIDKHLGGDYSWFETGKSGALCCSGCNAYVTERYQIVKFGRACPTEHLVCCQQCPKYSKQCPTCPSKYIEDNMLYKACEACRKSA